MALSFALVKYINITEASIAVGLFLTTGKIAEGKILSSPLAVQLDHGTKWTKKDPSEGAPCITSDFEGIVLLFYSSVEWPVNLSLSKSQFA